MRGSTFTTWVTYNERLRRRAVGTACVSKSSKHTSCRLPPGWSGGLGRGSRKCAKKSAQGRVVCTRTMRPWIRRPLASASNSEVLLPKSVSGSSPSCVTSRRSGPRGVAAPFSSAPHRGAPSSRAPARDYKEHAGGPRGDDEARIASSSRGNILYVTPPPFRERIA